MLGKGDGLPYEMGAVIGLKAPKPGQTIKPSGKSRGRKFGQVLADAKMNGFSMLEDVAQAQGNKAGIVVTKSRPAKRNFVPAVKGHNHRAQSRGGC